MRLRLNPELIGTLVWYWAPPGARPLPTPTAFASRVWETDWYTGDDGDLGEIGLTRTWSNGASPFGATGQGTSTPLDWFLNGVPAGVSGPWPNGICAGVTGEVICGNCLGGLAPTSHTANVEFAYGDWAPISGVQTLNYDASCTWDQPRQLVTLHTPPPDFTLIELFGPHFPVTISVRWRLTVRSDKTILIIDTIPPVVGNLWQAAPGWDCKSPLTVEYQPAVPGVYPKDLPRFITIDGVDDVLIGSIVWDAGSDAIPSRYLLANGQRVSQATYAQLFGRLLFTYGANLGDGTFALPNLVDRVAVGTGNLYALGAQGGEAQHTLVAAEVPDVPIVITDPGHQHSPAVAGESFQTRLTTGAFALPASGAGASRDAFTTVQTTGITANMPTAGGGAHNNLQPYTALRPLIYAGV